MTRIFKILLLGGALFVSTLLSAQNLLEMSAPSRLVNDFGGILNDSETARLESKLRQYANSTSTQIAVVSINSLEGRDISMYSVEVAHKWGIGQDGKGNGVLIMIAKADRKMFIATGYGMEGVLPDALAKRIVENNMKPNFAAGRFYQGIDEAIEVIFGLATGEFTADQVARQRRLSPGPGGIRNFIPILIIMLFSGLMPYFRYRNYRRSNVGSGALTFMAFMALSSSRRHGGYGGFSSGGGSFGGFGGGGFGGGGAGGSW